LAYEYWEAKSIGFDPGIMDLIPRVGPSFTEAVELIYQCTGRVVVSGIGKSGIIGRKIVATLNSTGTPALFLHPVEAMHGDLGMVTSRDILLAISNSGETEELNAMLPSARQAPGSSLWESELCTRPEKRCGH
jgi:arabinose-5-phosphate isomerase